MKGASVQSDRGGGTGVLRQRIYKDYETEANRCLASRMHRLISMRNCKAQCQVNLGDLFQSANPAPVSHMPPTGSLASHMTSALSPCRTTSSSSLTQCLAAGAGRGKVGPWASDPGAVPIKERGMVGPSWVTLTKG